jgi:hypothetical protein
MIREKKLRIKDKFERNNLGDFEIMYPLAKGVSEEQDELMSMYDAILVKSKEIWEESIAGGGYVPKKKESEPLKT